MNRSVELSEKYTAIELYEMVLREQLIQFPKKYWNLNYNDNIYSNAADITNYMFDKVLKWDEEKIKKKLNKYTFYNNKLGGMLKKIFNNCYFSALENARPGEFKRWEFENSSVGNKYWDKNKGIEAVKWLVEIKLGLDPRKKPIDVKKQTFIDNNLGGMLQHVFSNSPSLAIKSAYPSNIDKPHPD